MRQTFSIGSVISGTHRSEDLLTALANEVNARLKWWGDELDREHAISLAETANAARKLAASESDNDAWQTEASELVDELFDALNELAPSYVTFGAHDGDGADFGFWPLLDSMEEDAANGDLLKVDDLGNAPNGYSGEIMVVNDHGNVTFGYIDSLGEFVAVWDCV